MFFTAFLLNIVKHCMLLCCSFFFVCVQTSDLLLIPYGSCSCMLYSTFCVYGELL